MTEVLKRADRIPAERSTPSRLPGILFYSLLTLVVIIYSAPSIGVLLASFKSTAEIAEVGVWTLPRDLNFDNYREAWEGGSAGTYIRNSFLVTIPAMILSITLGVLAGYPLSKLKFPGSNALFVFIVAGLFFPPQIALIPLFRLFNSLGLYDTLWAIILIHMSFGIPICTLIMKNFFTAVPTAIREAAIVDGANEFQILVRLMIPLSLPALAVLATLQFTWIWNDFLWPVILIRSDEMRTVMVGLASLKGQYSVAYGVQSAMAVYASVPTLLVFVFFQRYFIQGLTLGSVKG
ncbi:MAG: carbohydrate ABC transporter permease [Chloroflexi bacterium]|nr:carbohydrate ABC transporter permease [Chloroflexota bacterium]